MFRPTFSVIIPTYRRPRALARCLERLALQRYPVEAFEVIVVDDANRPNELQHLVANGYPFEWRIVSQIPCGAARARNIGAQVARGRLLALTDDDCLPRTDWLRNLEQRMALAGEEALIGGRVVNELSADPYASATQALVDFLYERLNADPVRPSLLTSNNFCVASAAFQAIGGFDTTFDGAGGEDRELCLRWAHSGRPLVYAPEAVVDHAHALTLLTFLRQHFAYGRGAAHLRRRAVFHGYGPLRLEPASFYWDLINYPRRRSKARGRALQTVLFVLSQAANTAGYLSMSGRGRSEGP